MRISGIVEEDFIQYRKPSMFLSSIFCDWKCCAELGVDKSICQNSSIQSGLYLTVPNSTIYERYITNDITKAVVIGGLEPFLQYDEVLSLLNEFRTNGCMDDFVIYTGYYKDEILEYINELVKFKNVIIKFGRYVPNQTPHYDDVLGIYLASDNQYGERIS